MALEPDDSPQHPLAPWFQDARRRRSDRRSRAAPPTSAPRRAIITIVHNESLLLPIWLAHYGKYFAPRDIYVLDNETTDGSTMRDGFVRIPVSRDGLDNLWMVDQVSALQHDLLGRYDIVVVTDVDEIVAPSLRSGTLGDYLDRFDEEWVNCLGYEVIHQRDSEPSLRPDRPIMRQRGHWFCNAYYDKPAIASAPMSWGPGFHGRSDRAFNLDPDLRMIHLHRLDYEICKARHRERARRSWASLDARKGWGAHNFITDEPAFHRWFYLQDDAAHPLMRIERIPEPWRHLV